MVTVLSACFGAETGCGLQEWRYLQWTPEEHEWRWDALSKHLTHLIIFSLEVCDRDRAVP